MKIEREDGYATDLAAISQGLSIKFKRGQRTLPAKLQKKPHPVDRAGLGWVKSESSRLLRRGDSKHLTAFVVAA